MLCFSFFLVPREKGMDHGSRIMSGIGSRVAQGCLLIGPVLWGPLVGVTLAVLDACVWVLPSGVQSNLWPVVTDKRDRVKAYE